MQPTSTHDTLTFLFFIFKTSYIKRTTHVM